MRVMVLNCREREGREIFGGGEEGGNLDQDVINERIIFKRQNKIKI